MKRASAAFLGAVIFLIVALCLLGACSATWGGEHRRTIRAANATTAVLAAATTALDWCGTRHAAATRRTPPWESGVPTTMIIGTAPSPHAVDAYFAVSAAAVAVAAQVVPERYRWIVYGLTLAGEIDAVTYNIGTTRCGPIGSN